MSDSSDWSAADPGRPPHGIPPGPPVRPKPGVIPLRPLVVSEILDGAVAYVRSNPAVTLGFSAVVITITQLIQLPLAQLMFGGLAAATADADAGRAPSPDDLVALFGATLGGALLGGVVTFIATTVLSGLLIVVLGQAVLGRRMALAPAWAATRGRIPGLLGVTLLTTLLLVLVVAIGLVPTLIAAAVGSTSGSTALAAVAGLIVAGCLAIYLGVCWSMITPTYMLEGGRALGAFRRSYDLVRPQWWRVFGILLLGGIIAAVVGAVLSLPFSFVSTLVDGPADPANPLAAPGLGGSVITALGAILAGTLTAPFSAGITGLLYFDQRMRREGFDLELMRATETPSGQPVVPPLGPPTAAPADRTDVLDGPGPDLRKPDATAPAPSGADGPDAIATDRLGSAGSSGTAADATSTTAHPDLPDPSSPTTTGTTDAGPPSAASRPGPATPDATGTADADPASPDSGAPGASAAAAPGEPDAADRREPQAPTGGAAGPVGSPEPGVDDRGEGSDPDAPPRR